MLCATLVACARSEFLFRPAFAISEIQRGMEKLHADLWDNTSSECVVQLYEQLIPTAASTIALLREPFLASSDEEGVCVFFASFSFVFPCVSSFLNSYCSNLWFVNSFDLIVSLIMLIFGMSSHAGLYLANPTSTRIEVLSTNRVCMPSELFLACIEWGYFVASCSMTCTAPWCITGILAEYHYHGYAGII